MIVFEILTSDSIVFQGEITLSGRINWFKSGPRFVVGTFSSLLVDHQSHRLKCSDKVHLPSHTFQNNLIVVEITTFQSSFAFLVVIKMSTFSYFWCRHPRLCMTGHTLKTLIYGWHVALFRSINSFPLLPSRQHRLQR